MGKWNMIPSAEGPFKGLDARPGIASGCCMNRYKLSERSVDEYRSEKFLGARMVKLCDLNPRKFPGDTRTRLSYDPYCVYKQKDLADEMAARNAPFAAVWTRCGKPG